MQREHITFSILSNRLSRLRIRPRNVAQVVRHTAACLKGKVPPRVLASLFLLWSNGLVTSRRTGSSSRCKFCQAVFSDCSIEHFSQCQAIKVLGTHFVNTPRRYTREQFFCMHKESSDLIIQRACHVHLVKRTSDFLRHNPNACPVLSYRAQVWKLALSKANFVYKLSTEGLVVKGDEQLQSASSS